MGKRSGVYAPRHEPAVIDWGAMQAASDAARRAQQEVEEQAIEAAREFHATSDPVAQLIERVAGLEARLRRLEALAVEESL